MGKDNNIGKNNNSIYKNIEKDIKNNINNKNKDNYDS